MTGAAEVHPGPPIPWAPDAPGARRRRASPGLLGRIRELLRTGRTVEETARELGLLVAQVYRWAAGEGSGRALRDILARDRQHRAAGWADRGWRALTEPLEDWRDARRAVARSEYARWMASRLDPAAWGERVDVRARVEVLQATFSGFLGGRAARQLTASMDGALSPLLGAGTNDTAARPPEASSSPPGPAAQTGDL